MNNKFEFLEHTGDIKFKAYGKSLNEMFENCVLAVSEVFSRGEKIKSIKRKEFVASGKDYEAILYKTIEELIYLFDAEGFVVSKAKISVSDVGLRATIYGDDVSKYKDLDAIKSPTYAEMHVKQIEGVWEAQVVLDV